MKFVQQVEITLGGERVLSMENDISLATDPAIGFRFVPRPEDLPGKLKVTVRDSDNAVFEQSFDVPASGELRLRRTGLALALLLSACTSSPDRETAPEPDGFWTGPMGRAGAGDHRGRRGYRHGGAGGADLGARSRAGLRRPDAAQAGHHRGRGWGAAAASHYLGQCVAAGRLGWRTFAAARCLVPRLAAEADRRQPGEAAGGVLPSRLLGQLERRQARHPLWPYRRALGTRKASKAGRMPGTRRRRCSRRSGRSTTATFLDQIFAVPFAAKEITMPRHITPLRCRPRFLDRLLSTSLPIACPGRGSRDQRRAAGDRPSLRLGLSAGAHDRIPTLWRSSRVQT